jgi:hypothetical protein
MGLRRKKEKDLPKVARIEKMSNAELASWGEQSLVYLCVAFDNWKYHGHAHTEVLRATETLHTLLNEVDKRSRLS